MILEISLYMLYHVLYYVIVNLNWQVNEITDNNIGNNVPVVHKPVGNWIPN